MTGSNITLTRQDQLNYIKNQVPELLKKLNFHQKPDWGQMTAQHMVEHLASIVAFSTIISRQERKLPSKIQEEAQQLLIYSDADFPRNIMNPMYKDGLPGYTHSTIEIAKAQLITNIDFFFKTYDKEKNAHSFNPFFGDIDFDQLLVIHAKHFKHHFTQFGI